MHLNHYKQSAPKREANQGLGRNSGYQRLGLSLFTAMLICVAAGHSLALEEQNSATSAYECTQVAIEDVDPALLTKQERIALLDDSLTQSIDSYSTCVSMAAQNMSGGGSGQGTSGGGENGQSGSQNGIGENTTDDLENANGGQSQQQQEQTEIPPELPETIQAPINGSGSTPAPRGIIPPKNNDKIICKLLFQEITKTQDPDMLKGLKQQYSNYKCG